MRRYAMSIRRVLLCSLAALLLAALPSLARSVIVDTGQDRCYDATKEVACPAAGAPFYGQDAQVAGVAPAYRDNGDGTVSDLNTGLMWSKAVDPRKVDLDAAERLARELRLGGHDDWRVPTVTELYSLIDFRGYTGSFHPGGISGVPTDAVPFINTDYFAFAYGDAALGERHIDAQWLSRTRYVGTTMGDMETLFGVNFADGRIKGYGYRKRGSDRSVKTFFVRFVRGNPSYDRNDFVDNGDGTLTDRATGLMWTRADSGRPVTWQQALAYAEGLDLAGHADWRLPNAKELQFIVDYSRSPDTTGSAAIDPLFHLTPISNEAGQRDYPWYWSSTTHRDGPRPGAHAAYVAFGRAMGKWQGRLTDVHGAGAQRSDPKVGEAEQESRAPQGDTRRVRNYVLCVRGGVAKRTAPASRAADRYPQNVRAQDFATPGEGERPSVPMRGRQPGQGMNGNEPGQGMVNSGARQGRPAGERPDFVAHLDRDGDGRVSRAEFDGPPDRFDIHDRNHDGYLTEDEAPQGPPPGGMRGPRP